MECTTRATIRNEWSIIENPPKNNFSKMCNERQIPEMQRKCHLKAISDTHVQTTEGLEASRNQVGNVLMLLFSSTVLFSLLTPFKLISHGLSNSMIFFRDWCVRHRFSYKLICECNKTKCCYISCCYRFINTIENGWAINYFEDFSWKGVETEHMKCLPQNIVWERWLYFLQLHPVHSFIIIFPPFHFSTNLNSKKMWFMHSPHSKVFVRAVSLIFSREKKVGRK